MRRKTTAVLGSLFVIAIGFEGWRPFLSVDASNFKKPHAHTGKVPPFKPGDPHVKLDGKACAILKGGKPYSVSPMYPVRARLACSQRLSPDQPADTRRPPGPLAATRNDGRLKSRPTAAAGAWSSRTSTRRPASCGSGEHAPLHVQRIRALATSLYFIYAPHA